jgi:hypothetical protein
MAIADALVSGATVLYSNTGTALPNLSTVAFNAYGSWSSWTSLGSTASPVRVQHSKEYFFFDAQQYAHPLFVRLVGKRSAIRFEIAELTGATLALLLDGTLSTQAATGSLKGSSTIDYGSDLVTTEKQWGFEGFRPDANGTLQPVRWFFYKAVATLEGDFSFNKRASTHAVIAIHPVPDTGKTQGQDVSKLQIVTAPTT